eukprot:703763-Pleurochrysis_carterae.AAC.4
MHSRLRVRLRPRAQYCVCKLCVRFGTDDMRRTMVLFLLQPIDALVCALYLAVAATADSPTSEDIGNVQGDDDNR